MWAGCSITCKDGLEEAFDGCVIAAHAPNALEILGKQATDDELRILGAFQYSYRFSLSACLSPVNIHSLSFSVKMLLLLHWGIFKHLIIHYLLNIILGSELLIFYDHESSFALQPYDSDIFLHHDDNLMPKIRATWSSRNFLGTTNDRACITYWLNIVQVVASPKFIYGYILSEDKNEEEINTLQMHTWIHSSYVKLYTFKAKTPSIKRIIFELWLNHYLPWLKMISLNLVTKSISSWLCF